MVAQCLRTLGFIVCLQSHTSDRIPWLHGGFPSNEDFSPFEESERLNEAMQEISSTEDSVSSRTSSPYWEDDSDNTSSSSRGSSLQSSPTAEEQKKQAGLLCCRNLGQGIHEGSQVVELTYSMILGG